MRNSGRIPILLFFLMSVSLALIARPAGLAAPLTPHLVKFTAPDAASDDVFGFSVLVQGDRAFIGVPHKTAGGLDDAGAVYIYERNTGGPGNWGYVNTLNASDGAPNDHFGISLDMDGDTLVVGAYYDDDSGTVDEGSAYIFQKDAGGPDNWGEVAKLTAFDGTSHSLFGISVGLSGDTAVIGAREDSGGNGSAYVFERDEGGPDAWGLVKKLVASNGASGDGFGDSVAISADRIAAGARGRANGNGAAYLFDRNTAGPNSWGETKFFTPTTATENIYFGESVALDVETLAVSATGLGEGGGVLVYDRNAGGPDTWGLVRIITESGPEILNANFGMDIDLSGGVLAVGANLDDTGASDAGAVYVYEEDQGGTANWGWIQTVIADDAFDDDWLGFSVSIDGGLLLSGAYKDDDACLIDPACNSGSAYLFALPVTYNHAIWLPLVTN